MTDVIETLGRSLIQHGSYNDRVYVMKLHPDDVPGILGDIEKLCRREGYSKIFVRIPVSTRWAFDEAGYGEEARIEGFFDGREDALFMGLYPDPERADETHAGQIDEILTLAHARKNERDAPADGPDDLIRKAVQADIPEMARVYRQVFDTYPFPIHREDYLASTMEDNVRYFCVRQDGRIVACSSAEMDPPSRCVEMTDFATIPEMRGRSLAVKLLGRMEDAMRAERMVTAYTIARALSPGMNITFARRGYTYAGTLTNNTNISGHIESMNVWYRKLT